MFLHYIRRCLIQWLRLCASTAGGTDSIPGWGAKILHGEGPPPTHQKKDVYKYFIEE